MASRLLTARFISAGFELRDIGDRKAVEIGNVDVDPDPGADQRADQLRHRLDLGADIEHLRLQAAACAANASNCPVSLEARSTVSAIASM